LVGESSLWRGFLTGNTDMTGKKEPDAHGINLFKPSAGLDRKRRGSFKS
jgi:hypothetical protein